VEGSEKTPKFGDILGTFQEYRAHEEKKNEYTL
jgi:hypothetical protein